jgi:hypothetical protein
MGTPRFAHPTKLPKKRGIHMSKQLILFVVLAPVLVLIIFMIYLKLLEKLLNKLFTESDRGVLFIRPEKNKTVSKVGKYLIEVSVGFTIFVASFYLFSLPKYCLLATVWTPSPLISLLLVIFPVFFAVICTYKMLRIIHKNFDLNTDFG